MLWANSLVRARQLVGMGCCIGLAMLSAPARATEPPGEVEASEQEPADAESLETEAGPAEAVEDAAGEQPKESPDEAEERTHGDVATNRDEEGVDSMGEDRPEPAPAEDELEDSSQETAPLPTTPARAADLDYDPLVHDPRAVHARKVRSTGIGMTTVGGVLGVGAVAMFAFNPCEPEPGNDCRELRRRNAALSVGVPAAALFVAGVTTLAVGQARLNRLSLELGATRSSGAIALRGRF